MRSAFASQRGQSAVEYAGLLAVLALVFAALFTLDLPRQLRAAVSTAVCEVSGGDDCGGGLGGGGRSASRARPGDADGDGLSDKQEGKLGTSIRDDDSDGDGIADGEEVRRKLNPRSRDSDRDGIQDAREVRLTGANPLMADTDADGLPDAAELAAGTPIAEGDADTDGLGGRTDGLSDYEEIFRYGTDPRRIDTDGDGTGDGDEVRAGTNPLVDERSLGYKVGLGVTAFFLDDPSNLSPKGIVKGLGKGLGKLGVKLGLKKADDVVRDTAERIAAARKRREASSGAIPDERPPVQWVDESAAMSEDAARYQDAATGARSNVATRKGQAPSLRYTEADGKPSSVRFDGYDEQAGELIDRKISVTTFPKTQKQALRQSRALAEAGYRGVWEVPTPAEAARADRMFERLGIRNITTRVVPL